MKEFPNIKSFKEFVEKIRFSNRYFFDGEIKAFFKALIGTRGSRVKKCNIGTIFWRAQQGFNLKNETNNNGISKELKIPFEHDRMIPFRKKAKGGRANPSGIPHLYLATTKETAMAEVRPWLGSIISLATFKTTKELSIIDCYTNNLTNIVNKWLSARKTLLTEPVRKVFNNPFLKRCGLDG
jgi:hypothetical protein